jgi:hypothetical protein
MFFTVWAIRVSAGLVTVGNTFNPLKFFSLVSSLQILDVELDVPLAISNPSVTVWAPAGLYDRAPVFFAGGTVWNGYANQPAAGIVRASEARQTFGVQGADIVAVIDTGVDPNHPALRSVWSPDTTSPEISPDRARDGRRRQSTTAVVDGTPVQVNSSTIAVLNQSPPRWWTIKITMHLARNDGCGHRSPGYSAGPRYALRRSALTDKGTFPTLFARSITAISSACVEYELQLPSIRPNFRPP